MPYHNNPNKFVRGRTPELTYCVLFADTIASGGGDIKRVISHETGHMHELGNDEEPFPPESNPGLMVPGINAQGEVLPEPGIWMRHEYWETANETAQGLED